MSYSPTVYCASMVIPRACSRAFDEAAAGAMLFMTSMLRRSIKSYRRQGFSSKYSTSRGAE